MPDKKSAWQSPWVIAWVALVFVVLGANAIMVYLAIASNPGLVVEDYYERGRDYENNLAKRLSNDPGWTVELELPAHPVRGRPVAINATLLDRNGAPALPEDVVLHAYRPSDARQDFSVAMAPQGGGRYRVDTVFPLKGVWDLLVSVRHGTEEYNTPQRIEIQDTE